MRALILGASGQLGKRLALACAARNVPFVGTAHKRLLSQPLPFPVLPLDITDAAAVEKTIVAQAPTVVFLCASLTAVDYCEDHVDEARRINVDGVRHVVDASRKIDATVVFVSTDYVFDGKGGPYSETDATAPQSVYGKTKLDAERIVLENSASIVARTSTVYDWDPDSVNFVMQMIKRFKAGVPTKVISDQWSHPTLARNLADVLLELATQRATGVFHTVGPDYLSRFDFTKALVETFDFDASLLTPITTAKFLQKAPRPKKCHLLLDKLTRTIPTPLIGVRAGLEIVRRDSVVPAA